MGNDNYTLELKEVLGYVTDVLINEFPTDTITSEYLIMSILDNKNCHANMILDNCMMSNNLEELKKVYVQVLEKHMKPQVLSKGGSYDESWNKLLVLAEQECGKMNHSDVGTEHVLLAILNEEYNMQEGDIFRRFNLDYSFIFNKCNVPSNDGNKISHNNRMSLPNRKRNDVLQNKEIVQLKSQVNPKAFGLGNSEVISKYTTNITELVRNGELDDVIGRDTEVMEVIKVLARRKKNNAVIVGEAGCGKTSIVYKIAKLIDSPTAPSMLEGKEVVMLDIMALVSGTSLRGMFEERVKSLFDELKNSGKYILFIDDIHNVIRSGGKEKDYDLGSMISDILSDGKVRVIAATTFKDFRNSIEANSAVSKKFQKISIAPTTFEETMNIIQSNKKYYEEYHNVSFSNEVVETIIKLSERYVTGRTLPDSAIDVLDLCGANASVSEHDSYDVINLKRRLAEIRESKAEALNNGNFEAIDALNIEENVINCDIADSRRKHRKNDRRAVEISEANVLDVVSKMSGVPLQKLNTDDKKRMAMMNDTLKASVVGQDEAIDAICKVIKRNRVGLGNKNRCLGAILMAGKTGTGKTLLAKKLAEEVFGDENALVRIDMSEYAEKSSLSKLLGSSPGYIGYENGGQLTEAIKHKQYCVLLLDEIEKADQEVHNVFLQLFDDGRLTDSSGQVVNFKNVIVLMTSNIGAKKAAELGGGVGFVRNESENSKNIIEKEMKRKFTPEFLNRIDKIVHFNTLSNDNIKDIVKLELNKFSKRLNNINYNISYEDSVIELIYNEALKSKEFGARPILRLVQDNIEDKLTELMLSRDYDEKYTFKAWVENGEIKIQ